MRRLLPSAGLLLACLFLLAADGDSPPAIENLQIHRQDGDLVVSFELTNVFDVPTLERIRSGLPTNFTYVIRLENPRPMWWDGTMGRTTLELTATYNAVTQEYLVNTKQDDKLIDSRAVMSIEDLQRAMTMVSSLTAFELPEQTGNGTYVKVRAELGRRNFMLLFRRTVATDWARLGLDQPG